MSEHHSIDISADLHVQSSEMCVGIAESGAPVFLMGSTLVRVEKNGSRLRACPLSVHGIRHEASKACEFVKKWTDPQGHTHEKTVFPPMAVAQDALASGEFRAFKRLDGIVSHPTMSRDGSIVSGFGYDEKTLLYVDAAGLEVCVPENPTEQDIENARSVFLDLLCDFPLDSRASVAAAVALLLTLLLRSMIDGPVPIFIVVAPAPGIGKTLLVQAIIESIIGEAPAMLTEVRDDDELRKTLLAALLEMPEAVVIDNVNQKLDSGTIASIATSGRFKGRILGQTSVADVPVRAPIIPTGNNLAMSNELARRSVVCRLESNTAQPWTRDGFRHPALLEWVREHRAEIITAGLTMGRAWIAAGRPKPKGKPLGSFESWHRVIGGVLESAGIPGLLENANQFYESADTETLAWTSFCSEWAKAFPVGGVPSRDLVELALKCEVIDEGRSERSTQTALGRALSKMAGRVFGSYKIKKLSIVSGLQFWKVEATA